MHSYSLNILSSGGVGSGIRMSNLSVVPSHGSVATLFGFKLRFRSVSRIARRMNWEMNGYGTDNV